MHARPFTAPDLAMACSADDLFASFLRSPACGTRLVGVNVSTASDRTVHACMHAGPRYALRRRCRDGDACRTLTPADAGLLTATLSTGQLQATQPRQPAACALLAPLARCRRRATLRAVPSPSSRWLLSANPLFPSITEVASISRHCAQPSSSLPGLGCQARGARTSRNAVVCPGRGGARLDCVCNRRGQAAPAATACLALPAGACCPPRALAVAPPHRTLELPGSSDQPAGCWTFKPRICPPPPLLSPQTSRRVSGCRRSSRWHTRASRPGFRACTWLTSRPCTTRAGARPSSAPW